MGSRGGRELALYICLSCPLVSSRLLSSPLVATLSLAGKLFLVLLLRGREGRLWGVWRRGD